MDAITEETIAVVLDAYEPERAALLAVLEGLDPDQWEQPTECPAYPVKGIAAHVLGDDLSLLSRQRDGATQGLILMAEKMPGADFRGLLDGFNDQWVEAARFMSPAVLIELLRLSGEWTAQYYRAVDPAAPGEPVPLFGPSPGEGSPFWHAIAREYLERWTHQSQIRRALGLPSLGDTQFLGVGARIVGTVMGGATVTHDDADEWVVGELTLGSTALAADILTLALSADEVAARVGGPPDLVAQFALRVGRRLPELE